VIDNILNGVLYFIITPVLVVFMAIAPGNLFFWIEHKIHPNGSNRRDKNGNAL